MGIVCKSNIMIKKQDEFNEIDSIVTGYAFDIQNAIGRFCDEKIYQEIMKQKCQENKIKVLKEVNISLTYKDFVKNYKIDLLVDDGIIYELKAVKSLNGIHKQQLINYLLLTEIKHGKLLNFGSSSVEYEFVSTTLTKHDRFNFSFDTSSFCELTDKCEILKNRCKDLLNEWGAFLGCDLYNKALIHFLGGDKIIYPVDIFFNNKIVGKQNMLLLNKDTIFHLSALTKSVEGYEKNIRKLLKYSAIKNIQWVNFNKNKMKIKTIKQ